ncbi:hypothetical protein [Micromonospora mirobrigensis]|uniref:Uncharacterized protein n=1 Tax=Micromonospora mirobrigensis TaxID=262898 RepID=A0A1C4U7M6_9ACTN|nr:hypothetical protein [Micromonospora mirobrigensis]SCE67656.1 hypothetical protein GA0070564_101279 [Micromonospora mirobrigensis]
MTDEHLDRMVRDADPYRPEAVRHLDGVAQHLLEEIMSTPTLAPATEEPPPPRPARRGLVSGLAAAGVAAVLLTGFVAATALRPAPPDGRQASPVTPVTASAGPQAVAYSAMVLKAAEQNPRLLIDQPGWKATTVYGFTEKQGTIGFTNGDRQVEMNWYPAEQHQNYYRDRLGVSKPEKVTVDGQPADLFRYSGNDFAVMLRPRDGSFVELRAGGMRRAEFDRMLAAVVRVDVRTWLAALPAEIVTPDRIEERAATVLADVPLPPGFDKAALSELGVNDSYQFGAQVTARVGCGWIEEWLRARKAGDDAAAKRAVDALRSSHKWKVLHDMNEAGDYPEVFWEYADKVADGDRPAGYRSALGCD